MFNDFFFSWVIVHTLVLGIGFGVGLAAGLKIPILGDVIAMLVVGLLLIFAQQYLLLNQFDMLENWVLYSFIGLIAGVAGSFLFILLTDKYFGLKNSHIYSFPISLVVYTLFQTFLLTDIIKTLYIWPIISIFSLLVAFLLLFLINKRYDLALDLLATRTPEYSKTKVWALIGTVLGFTYGIFTGWILS